MQEKSLLNARLLCQKNNFICIGFLSDSQENPKPIRFIRFVCFFFAYFRSFHFRGNQSHLTRCVVQKNPCRSITSRSFDINIGRLESSLGTCLIGSPLLPLFLCWSNCNQKAKIQGGMPRVFCRGIWLTYFKHFHNFPR